MRRYSSASGKTSAGVSIRRSMAGVASTPAAVSKTQSPSVSTTVVCTDWRSFSLSLAP